MGRRTAMWRGLGGEDILDEELKAGEVNVVFWDVISGRDGECNLEI